MNMQALMQQAQKMQRDITEKKEEINKMEFEGTSELVTVTVNGRKEIVKVIISDEISSDDKEVLEDMILIATNKAMEKVDKEIEAKLGKYSSALNGMI